MVEGRTCVVVLSVAGILGSVGCGGESFGPAAGTGATPLVDAGGGTTIDGASALAPTDSGADSAPAVDAGLDAASNVVTVASQVDPNRIAIDGTSIYWTDGDRAVMKMPLSGGTPTMLAPEYENIPFAIAVDRTSVYWTTLHSDGQGGDSLGTVRSMPLDGGTPTTLASGQDTPTAIAVDSTSVYWVTEDGNVMKVARSGGTATTLATGQSGAGRSLAIDGTSAYWTNTVAQTGSVMKVSLDGGTPVTLSSPEDAPYGIAVDGASVYWTNANGGTVRRMPLAGGAITTIATTEALAPHEIFVSATGVYWIASVPTNADPGGGNQYVMTAPLTGLAPGRTPTTLATGVFDEAFAIGATTAYLSTPTMGGLVRVALH